MKLCPVCNSQLPDNQEVPELVPLGYHEDALALSIKRRIAAEEKLRWIPVSERLPTENDAKNNRAGYVLVHRKSSAWDFDMCKWHNVEYLELATHWMPLPDPPQEVE